MASSEENIYIIEPLPPPYFDIEVIPRASNRASKTNEKEHSIGKQYDIFGKDQNIGKNIDSEISNEPNDRLYFVLVVVGLLGLVHMLPYTFFMTANEYWMYKFRNTTSNSTDANERTYLQTNFNSLNQLYTTVPTVLSNFLLAFVAHKIKAMTRIIFTLALHTSIFGTAAIFAKINTDSWQDPFYFISVVMLILLMSSISFGAAGQFGLFSRLPPVYIKAYLVGEGFAAMFNAIMRLISIVISPSPTGSALIYFVTGSALMFLSTILTVIAGRTRYFRYYNSNTKADKKEKVRDTKELFRVTKCVWHMIFLNALFIMAPLSSIYNLVVSENSNDPNNVWANRYFVTVCTFLIPSIANTFGRAIYSKIDWDCPIPIIYLIVTGFQAVSTTCIFFANAKPRHHLPVILTHDWQYSFAMATYAFLQGFIATLMSMKTIRLLPGNRVELGMLILTFFMSIAGAAFSPLGIYAVKIL
ncbi:equilibrative nucleoside transporter 1-like [Sitophilus oryzae]|uniref:Equilibrative nucleoside transporter 1-like n=1 Tax=Sitophilus oryzae TaxID=7048 RepID=A0A6J2Y7Y3_SITOR|nr:equilibrative nucleoside transporter 1-like [Sitophilus oryzae]